MSFDSFKDIKTVKLYKDFDSADSANGNTLTYFDVEDVVVEIPKNITIENESTRVLVILCANYILLKPLENFYKFKLLKEGKIPDLTVDVAGVVGYQYPATGSDAIWDKAFNIYGKLDCQEFNRDFENFKLYALLKDKENNEKLHN